MLSQNMLKSWCSELPFLVFWGDKFCLKCLLNRLLYLCLFLFVWLHVQVLDFIWSTSLSWHVHSYPGLLSLGTLNYTVLFVCMWHLKNVISKAIKARYINIIIGPGMGHLPILHGPGFGHLPTLGPPTSLWPARGFLSNITSKHERFYFKHKQIGRLAHLSKTWKIVEVFNGLISQFYAFIFSLLIKPELTYSCGKIGSFGHESLYFFFVIELDFCWSGILVE